MSGFDFACRDRFGFSRKKKHHLKLLSGSLSSALLQNTREIVQFNLCVLVP
jgi:hypothetical protein